jgi:hypothetical protein
MGSFFTKQIEIHAESWKKIQYKILVVITRPLPLHSHFKKWDGSKRPKIFESWETTASRSSIGIKVSQAKYIRFDTLILKNYNVSIKQHIYNGEFDPGSG